MTTRESRPGEEAAPEIQLVADQLQRNGNGSNGLRAALESAGGSLKDWTVLSPQVDPFRLDTRANHRDAQWLADAITMLRISMPRHLRGLHYVLLGQVKPDGEPYINDHDNWLFLEKAARAARYLDYIPFEWIVDKRNGAPELIKWRPTNPRRYMSVDFDMSVPSLDDLQPRVGVSATPQQPYHLVFVGEKDSLDAELGPLARRYGADLFLPTGEITHSHAYIMAKAAAEDPRPMVLMYFADSDPAGRRPHPRAG